MKYVVTGLLCGLILGLVLVGADWAHTRTPWWVRVIVVFAVLGALGGWAVKKLDSYAEER